MSIQALLFIHPSMSVEFLFETTKQRKYKIFSVITSLEKTHLETAVIEQHSDVVFKGSDAPEKDLKEIQQIIHEHRFQIVAIINGIDATLYYTDYLQKKILDYAIDLEATKIRLNKYAVNMVLRKHHLPHIPSVEVVSKTDLITQANDIQKLGLPIIAKPSEDTAAMSGVEIIASRGDLNRYLDQYLHKPNMYYPDRNIEKVILQEYIPTDQFEEYVIDFISYEGKHYCTSILHYVKEIREGKYRIDRFRVPHTKDEMPGIDPVISYMRDCLTALNVRYGFTHNEVFWDRGQKFYLIESNNRIAGGGQVEINQNVYGTTSFSQYLDLLQGKSIHNVPNERKSYSIGMDLFNCFVDGADQLRIEDIRSVQKIIHFRLKHKNDLHFYRRYTRVANINARILLNNQSKAALDKDVQTILSRETDGSLFFKSK